MDQALRRYLDGGVKALSVRTPWAWLIVAGYKDVENRTWTTDYRGPLLIHAGYTQSPEGYAFAERQGIAVPEDLPRGGIIGIAELTEVTDRSDSPWYAPGHYAWHMASPKPLPLTPCRGRLGLFVPAIEVEG